MNEKIIFLDIDGTIIKHHGGSSSNIHEHETVVLPDIKKKLDEWEVKGYQIVITTGRKESFRKFTEDQLFKAGIAYDQLVMGLGNGERVVINDKKPNGTITARAICIERNEGIGGIEL